MYSKTNLALALAAVAVGLFVATGQAQQGKVIEAKAEKGKPATEIMFCHEFNLPFTSLCTLGGRIEAARMSPDPITLANCAQELAIAEKASGKKASLTSEALMKEAVELAMKRQIEAELKAISVMTTDDNTRQKLADLQKQPAPGERDRTRGVRENLVIRNNSSQYVCVHYNGRELGEVPPGTTRTFRHIHDFSGDHFDLDGYGCQGGRWRLHRHGDFNTFTWTLNP
jgi:hypothetical protein